MTEPNLRERSPARQPVTAVSRLNVLRHGRSSDAQRVVRDHRAESARERRHAAEEAVARALRKVGEAGCAAALARLQSRYLVNMQRSPAASAELEHRQALQLRLARFAALRARADAYRAARAADQAIAAAQHSCREARGADEISITDLVAELDRAGGTSGPRLERAS